MTAVTIQAPLYTHARLVVLWSPDLLRKAESCVAPSRGRLKHIAHGDLHDEAFRPRDIAQGLHANNELVRSHPEICGVDGEGGGGWHETRATSAVRAAVLQAPDAATYWYTPTRSCSTYSKNYQYRLCAASFMCGFEHYQLDLRVARYRHASQVRLFTGKKITKRTLSRGETEQGGGAHIVYAISSRTKLVPARPCHGNGWEGVSCQ